MTFEFESIVKYLNFNIIDVWEMLKTAPIWIGLLLIFGILRILK